MLTARHAVVVCIGSRGALPDVPGIAEARPWTNRKATDSSEVPARLAIVGDGGVAVEMATAWQGLGASVTLLSRGPGLLPRMESFAGEMVADGLKEAGVDLRTNVSVTEMRRLGGTGPVTLLLDEGSDITADEVLVAVGRESLTDDIGLDTIGLTAGSWLDVDDTCQVRGVEDGSASRRRRREPPGPADPPGQVPGPPDRQSDRGARRGATRGYHTVGPARDHRRHARRAAGVLLRPGGRRRRSDRRPGATRRTPGPDRRRRLFAGTRRAALRRRLPRSGPDGRRPRPRIPARRHLRRSRTDRVGVLRDRRRRRAGPHRPALARGAVLSDHQRNLAAAARGLS